MSIIHISRENLESKLFFFYFISEPTCEGQFWACYICTNTVATKRYTNIYGLTYIPPEDDKGGGGCGILIKILIHHTNVLPDYVSKIKLSNMHS